MESKYDNICSYISLRKYPEGFSKSQKFALRRYAGKFTLKQGELFFGNRKAVRSKKDARQLFEEVHSSAVGGHAGIVKTRAAMCSRFYWHGMTVDIDTWVSLCDKCQRPGKPLRAAQPSENDSPVSTPPQLSAAWDLLGIDVIGPLPQTADGYQFIFSATDYFSKWIEAVPLKTKTSREVAEKICQMIYRHGCPKHIVSVQRQEFVNELNRSLCGLLGVERIVTLAANHPQTKGLDGKTNNNLKQVLTKLVNDRQNKWDVYLDAVLFSLRSKPHPSTNYTPFMLMYGREAVFPAEVSVDVPSEAQMKMELNCRVPEEL